MDTEGRDYVRDYMPMIGIGTYQLNNEDQLEIALDEGLKAGYRMIDTAQLYGTEEYIGDLLSRLLPKHNLKREDIFICSKLTPHSHGAELAAEVVEQCLDDLQTDYLDLMLIHWPGVCKMPGTYAYNPSLRMESYRTLEKYYKSGELKAIGVSNYDQRHLKLLLEECQVLPAINQIEYHPHFHQTDLLDYCKERGILFQAYSSLGNTDYKDTLFSDPTIVKLAEKYSIPVPTFLLAWSINQGISVLPRSTNPCHIRDNFKAKEMKISDEDINILLNNGIERKVCWDSSYIL